jgi:hypothetical protein
MRCTTFQTVCLLPAYVVPLSPANLAALSLYLTDTPRATQGFLPALPPDIAVEFHVFQSQLFLSIYFLQISTFSRVSLRCVRDMPR